MEAIVISLCALKQPLLWFRFQFISRGSTSRPDVPSEMMARNVGREWEDGYRSNCLFPSPLEQTIGGVQKSDAKSLCQDLGIPSLVILLQGTFILFPFCSQCWCRLRPLPFLRFNCVEPSFIHSIARPGGPTPSVFHSQSTDHRQKEEKGKHPAKMHAPSSFLAVAAFLPAAFAHYNFEALIVNGNVTSPYEYVRQTNNSNSPITDITSSNMICNSGGLGGSSFSSRSSHPLAFLRSRIDPY